MFLALYWLFTLWININVTGSVLVQATEYDECRPWSFYNETLHHCQCYELVPGFHYTIQYKSIECSERKTTEQLEMFF